ncbi:hypothetical protein [Roseovarius aestuarii]|uniref:Uncharacterized protein n=1 Tax=Roseovarius aestuarii TaxID=475083 RepID=A0A1X7BR39_9RHOB|nr:hypothetical protein [Roseovarius aestuarii]SMC12071.1 hypothetical protein ROA7745_01894 [Roseovarius aestuarii]
MFKRLFSVALIFGAAAMAPPAFAQSANCMPRDALVQKLMNKFDEEPQGGGLQNAQQLLEVWSSDRTGSFTVFITRPNGQSCVVATGQNWMGIVSATKDGIAS